MKKDLINVLGLHIFRNNILNIYKIILFFNIDNKMQTYMINLDTLNKWCISFKLFTR